MVDAVYSQQSASSAASAHQASAGHTVRIARGVHFPAKMEEPVSKTLPTHSSTAATAPCTSLDAIVRIISSSLHSALMRSVKGTHGIRCVMTSVTTMNVSGMEEIARSIGRSHGSTVLLVFRAGISLKMDSVIRSVTTLGASLTALSARRPHKTPASMLSTSVKVIDKTQKSFKGKPHNTHSSCAVCS